MRPFVIRTLTISFVVAVVLKTMGTSGCGWLALIAASLFLGLLNALARTFLLRLGIPMITLLTGITVLALNALFFIGLASFIPPYQVYPLSSALIATVIVSMVSWPLNLFFRGSDGHMHSVAHPASSTPPPNSEG